MKEALNITFTGLIVVFLGLTILFFIFLIMSKLLAGRVESLKFVEPKREVRRIQETPTIEEDLKIEAIISAVMNLILESPQTLPVISKSRRKSKWKVRGWKVSNSGWKDTNPIEWRRGVKGWSGDFE